MQRYKLGKLGGKKLMAGRLRLSKLPGVALPITGLVALAVALVVVPYVSLRDDVHAEGASGNGLAISLSANSLALSSSASDASGFVSASVTSSVTSTAAGGYNLYMSASGKDQAENYTASLVNANDKQYTIGTLPANSNIDLSFSTSDGNRAYANTSSFTANKWAYSVADITGGAPTTGTSTFKAIPLDETVINTTSTDSTTSSTAINTLNGETTGGVASTRPSNIFTKKSASGAAGDGASADEIEVTIAARTDNATPAGNYTNTLVFTVIGIDYSGVIVYDPNGEVGDGTSAGADGTTTVGGDMSMVTHTNVASGDSVNLYAPNYWRKGYGFAGWSEDKDAATKLANNETATVYGPQETITAPSTISSAGMRLYATWIKSAGDMQGWNGCNSMSTGSITALTDTRDNNTYAIAKLADNKCWVVENYRLASGTINTDNTNNPAGGFALPASSNNWCTDRNAACDDQVNINTNNINHSLTASPNTNSNSVSWYSYGVMYNWHTATAGYGKYETTPDYGHVPGDICPNGWHLPTAASTGEYQALYNALNTMPANIRKYPNNFILASGWYGASTYHRGEWASYWTSMTGNNEDAYRLYFHDNVFSTASLNHKGGGTPIRCIVDMDSYTINYNANGGSGTMSNTHANVKTGDAVDLVAPNFSRTGYGFLGWSTNPNAASITSATIYGSNETISAPNSYGSTTLTLYAIWKASEGDMQSWSGCSAMNVGDVTALTDTRDNDTYAVAKLADNKCWQIENLRLSSGTVDATNTNNPVSGFTWTESSNSWCIENSSACDDKVTLNTNNINSSLAASPTANNNSSSWYGYGTMYNWYTATAGRGTYSMASGNTTGDICPTGWHLPTSTSSGEFQAMYAAIGSAYASIRKYPNNFVLPGSIDGGRMNNRGIYANYWSSTANGNNNAYYLTFTRDHVTLTSNLNKYRGYSVRCLANTPTASAGTIVYNSNGGSGDMSMVTHTGVSNNANVQLYAPNYWRSGYGFLGWSTDPQAESKIGTANAATIYGPQETITAPSDIATNGMILYAVWKKSEGNMQDWKGCSSMSIGDVTALTDTRDNDTYAVAKLADNKCWSIENIRLGSGTISSTTTNNPESGFALTESSNSWCTGTDSGCINQTLINTNNINTSLTASPTLNNGSGYWYGYGVYYDWFAATAGRGTSVTAGSTTGDICPLGWHLPTSGSNSADFAAMVTAAGGTTASIMEFPYNFIMAGDWTGTYANVRGTLGIYWASTAYSADGAHNIQFDTSGVFPSYGNKKYYGRPIRCLIG